MDVTIEADQISSGKVRLVPNVVCSIRIPWASNVEVISDGAAEVWYRAGTTPPTLGGQHCWYIPAGGMAVDRRADLRRPGSLLMLISDGSPTVVVQRG